MNIAQLLRIDLNLLVLFHVVLEERHVGRAAERLSLTSSAVSHGLRRLRKHLNDPLFLRTPKGVVPTARALTLSEPVAEMLSRAQGVLQSAVPFEPATTARRFIIAAPDAVLSSTAPLLLKRIASDAPFVDIGLIHAMPGQRAGSSDVPWAESLAMLDNREIDLAMLPIGRTPRRFQARRLYDEDFVVAADKGHPYAKAKTEAAFCDAKHLLVSREGDPHGFIDEMLARRGRSRRVALTVPSFEMALTHLPGSELLAVLPRRLVRQRASLLGLVEVELPFSRKADAIQAVVTKAALRDAGVVWLARLVSELRVPRAGGER